MWFFVKLAAKLVWYVARHPIASLVAWQVGKAFWPEIKKAVKRQVKKGFNRIWAWVRKLYVEKGHRLFMAWFRARRAKTNGFANSYAYSA
jgi:hypothetical protein